jgi:hypothetical protein
MRRGCLLIIAVLCSLPAWAQRTYTSVTIANIISNNPEYWSTLTSYVSVAGYLVQKAPQKDGDIHFVICDSAGFKGMDPNHCINGEIVPYLQCSPLPADGAHVTIRGEVHWDGKEHWWEVHPIEDINGISCYVEGTPNT